MGQEEEEKDVKKGFDCFYCYELGLREMEKGKEDVLSPLKERRLLLRFPLKSSLWCRE